MQQIYCKTPGETWIKVCKLVMRDGKPIQDGETLLKEVINLFISIEVPFMEDKLLKRFGNKHEKEWMRKLWLTTTPTPEISDPCNRFPVINSYGSRIFDVDGKNNLNWIIEKLKANQETKSATISTIHLGETQKARISCITTLDFKIREDRLFVTAFVRSHDAYKKLPWDTLFLGELSKMASEKVGVTFGLLNFFVVSEHIYENDFKEVKELIKSARSF